MINPPPPGGPPQDPPFARRPVPPGAPGLGAGIGFGLLGFVLGTLIGAVTMPVTLALGIVGVLWPYWLIPVIGLFMLGSRTPRVRRAAIGVLIVSAAWWIIITGPCIYLLMNVH